MLRAFAAALLLTVSAQPALAGEPAAADKGRKSAILVPDPAVRFGTLANGLHYAVMQNSTPKGAVSVRLAVGVGSYVEAEDERGYAHFIEHLAFRSTRLAPNGVLDDRFARLGVALGRDQNAFTSLLSTLYAIDLPTNGEQGLEQILTWLRSGAEDILFTPEAVSAERRVVVAELQTRNNPLAAASREVMHFQAPGLRSTEREPGGTEGALAAATPARLQAFYDRWYRPENATLIIVGDAPADQLQALVERSFGGWKARGAAGQAPQPPAALPERKVEAFALSNSAMPAAASACRLAAREPDPPPLERVRREALSRLWTGMLGERLKQAASAAGSPILGGLATVNRDLPDARATCLVMVPVSGKWKEALALGQAELRRFAKDGPTESELKKAVADLEAPLFGAVAQQGSRPTPNLANAIAAAALDKRPFQSPSGAVATVEAALGGVGVAEVREAFARDWSGSGPLVAVVAPEAPAKAAVLAAWQGNETAAPLAAYADRPASRWAYDFGTPGKVERREVFSNPEFVRIRFANGALLNFRHSDLEAGDVEIRIRFGQGASGLAPAERGPAQIGAGLFPSGGLGRMDFDEIRSAFANTSWRFDLAIPTSAFLLSSSTLADQTAGELKLLAAYMTDPGFRPTIDEKLPTALDFAYRYLKTDPASVAMNALEQKLFPSQGGLPPREAMAAWRAKDFERLLKPALTRSPIEVTIVGDIGEETATKAMAASFGALPPRPAQADGPRFPFRRFPDRTPPPVTGFHEGPSDKAAAMLVWPLYVATPERRKEEYALSLVAAIFQSRLLQQVRVKMGKVYSPAVATAMPDHADQGSLIAGLEAAPGDIDAIVAAAEAIAADLAAGRISQDEVDKARQPMVAARLQAQSRNAAWASVLAQASHEPAVLDELLAYPRQMAEISLDDVRKAAATWLSRRPILGRALPRPPATAAAATPPAPTGKRRR